MELAGDTGDLAQDLTVNVLNRALEELRSHVLSDIEQLLTKAFQEDARQQFIEDPLHKALARKLSKKAHTAPCYLAKPVSNQPSEGMSKPDSMTHESNEADRTLSKIELSVGKSDRRFSDSETPTEGSAHASMPDQGALMMADTPNHALTSQSSACDQQSDVDDPESPRTSRWVPFIHTKSFDRMQAARDLPSPWPPLSKLCKDPVAWVMTVVDKVNCIAGDANHMNNMRIAASGKADTSSLRARIARCVRSSQFSLLVVLCMIGNAAWLGFVTDYEIRLEHERSLAGTVDFSKNSTWNTIKLCVDVTFLVVFSAELILRVYVEKMVFIVGPEAKWNLFDLFVVGSGLFEIILSGINLSFARVLRLLRMVKMLRVVRMVSLFKGLRMMVISVCGCLLSLVWLALLMLVIIYVYALGFMQMYLQELSAGRLAGSTFFDKTIYTWYGSVGQAMLTLFMAISGGCDWKEAMDPIWGVSPAYGFLFLFYIVFIVFGVLNVVTGVFVDRALEIAAVDKELVVHEEMRKRKKDVSELKRFFLRLDENGDGQVTKKEMSKSLEDPWLQSYVSTMDLDCNAMLELFDLLDSDGAGTLSIEEFIQGCIRIRGDAKAVDLFALLRESRARHKIMTQFKNFTENRLLRIEQALALALEDFHI